MSKYFEYNVSAYFRNKGYEVTKKGYPDFLIFRIVEDKILYAFVEVKNGQDWATKSQKFMLNLMRLHQMPVNIVDKVSDLEDVQFATMSHKVFKDSYKKFFKGKYKIKKEDVLKEEVSVKRIKIRLG